MFYVVRHFSYFISHIFKICKFTIYCRILKHIFFLVTGFAGSDILDTLLSTLLRPGSSDQPSNFRTPFPRLSVNADFNFLRNQMQSSGWKLLTIYPGELIWYLFLYFCCCLLGANSIMLHNYIFISKGCILLFIYFIS